ncbi:MAG: response regulator [Candidatus Bathyarchaeota archaeon]|nr:response regulator [Candidatus Bathyarchaeota archaeon]
MSQALVLLVDDDETSTQVLKMILEDEGFEVDVAATGGEAVEKVLTKSYQVILLDYVLPDMRGRDVAVKIGESGQHPKIILLTGYNKADENLGEKSYDLIMLKPAPPAEIVKAIREALKG